MNRAEIQDMLSQHADRYQMTGSRYICDPAPTNTDEDYIALSSVSLPGALLDAGFVLNTDPDRYEAMPKFMAWKLGEFNVIETESAEFYDAFVRATEQAKALNLVDKADRIALFRSVLYNEPTREVFP